MILLLASTLLVQTPRVKREQQRGKSLFDQRVDRAIARGVQYLKRAGSPGHNSSPNAHELILFTLLHAGVSASDPYFQKLFKQVTTGELKATYSVALQAMLLEEMDRVRYQGRIYQCAQFLVDNQSPDGQWGYGEPTAYEELPQSIATYGRPVAPGMKPPLVRNIVVKKKRDGGGGDSSNSQYAALGLRACHDAGILLPPEVIERSDKYWRRAQRPDRGWGYEVSGDSCGSMTAGAVGALAIYAYIRDGEKQTWKTDKNVLDGTEWLARNFSVTENPGKPRWFAYYYLYGLERAGVLFGTERFGAHEWYPEGAEMLLGAQRPDGSWHAKGDEPDPPEWDTCFAILFLKRATRTLLIPTGEARGGRGIPGVAGDEPVVVDELPGEKKK